MHVEGPTVAPSRYPGTHAYSLLAQHESTRLASMMAATTAGTAAVVAAAAAAAAVARRVE